MLRVTEQAARTDTGRQRRSNEDSYFARAPIFAVADGMGGAQAGEVASQVAAEAFEELGGAASNSEQALRDVAKSANRRIWELANEDSSRSGMGTTLTALIVGEGDVSIAHVGDSRAYLFREGELKLLTRDHSLVEELKRRGQISESEAEQHPQRSIITRALGPEPEVEVDTHTHTAREGDTFILCSDGLTTMVSDEQIAIRLNESTSLDQAVSALVGDANISGGRDNITVVAFRLADTDHTSDVDQTLLGVASPLAGEATESPAPELAEAKEPTAPAVSRGSRPRRRIIAVAAATLVLAVLIAGSTYGLRQVYFVGVEPRGLVTVYQGLPYELPGGVKLYSQKYVSAVTAASLKPVARQRLLDHELRSESDALSLARSVERQAR